MPARHRKFSNRSVKQYGMTFDSVGECDRWGELCLLELNGEISSLVFKPSFDFVEDGILMFRYTADFKYHEDGKEVIEDFKGSTAAITELWLFKRKLIEQRHGIRIRVTLPVKSGEETIGWKVWDNKVYRGRTGVKSGKRARKEVDVNAM